jgi:hypothetical protein
MGLKEELEKMRPSIKTDSYSMSIGEWISLYEHREIDIHPEFQRFFRWDENQKTRFIESILLDIPIPPIFVAQRADGVWDVVDGLQRLSTIYEFAGILKRENGDLYPPLVLNKTKYLPSLGGKKWDDPENSDNSFDGAQRMYIKRAKLHANIILRESDDFAKYELFQRINTGGSQLSDQEIRNCILVQMNPNMYRWLDELANYDNFINCAVLTERAVDERYDQELVLRFIIFRKEPNLTDIGDMGEYLTNKMIDLASDSHFNMEEEGRAFKGTFDILAQATKDNSFRKYDAEKNKFVGGFLITPFEVVALGIGFNYPNTLELNQYEDLIRKFWYTDYRTLPTGSGVRASTRIPAILPYGRKLFQR